MIPEGAELYIYNPEKTMIKGPVTSEHNRQEQTYATGPLKGSAAILEYYEPKAAIGRSKLNIGYVIHAFKDIYPNVGATSSVQEAASATCLEDVNCYSSWSNEAKGVVRYLASGGANKVGSALMNNTSQDRTPYILTADHVVRPNSKDPLNLPNDIFQFFYQTTSCNSGVINNGIIEEYTGADIRVRHPDTDLALLELKQNLRTNSDCYYFLGWSRSSTAPSSTTTIHFPGTNPMKIAFGGSGSPFITSPNNRHVWKTTINGQVSSGSSGAPLFNQNKQIVGALDGGPLDQDCVEVTYFGRMDLAWNGNDLAPGSGVPYSSLKQYLDKANTGASSLGPLFSTNIPSTVSLNIQNNNLSGYNVCYAQMNILTATYSGSETILEYQWQGPSGWNLQNPPPPPSDKSVAFVTPNSYSAGNIKIRARSRCGWSNWTTFSFNVQQCSGYFSVFPNPSNEYLDIVIEDKNAVESNDKLKSEIEIKLFNNSQKQVIDTKTKSKKTRIDTSTLPKGTYFLHVGIKDDIHKRQIVIE